MKPQQFLSQVDDSAIVAAIRRAEAMTTGEIRVFISNRHVADPVATARWHFTRLKMDQTKERNGVLMLIAPASQNFAIIGDSGIHSRCGEGFWAEIVADLGRSIGQAALTDGIVKAIEQAGRQLAVHFPHQPGDMNELPDDIQRD